MFIFIWQGRGYLVLLAIIAVFALTAIMQSIFGFQGGTTQVYVLECIFTAILFLPIWFYGKKWNSQRYELIDKATGKEIVITNQHRAFWVPMQYWAIIWPAILILLLTGVL